MSDSSAIIAIEMGQIVFIVVVTVAGMITLLTAITVVRAWRTWRRRRAERAPVPLAPARVTSRGRRRSRSFGR